MRRRRPIFRFGRTAALALVATLALLLGAGPASAHATVESTSPAQGSEVATAPNAVVLTFSEGVGISFRSIRVVDTRGQRVDTGGVTHPGGDARRASVRLVPRLPQGSYLVVWQVVSDDSHPVSGSFTFGYGVPAAGRSAAQSSDPLLGTLHAVVGFTALAGTVVLLGAVFFFILLWPQGLTLARSRRLVVWSWAAVWVSTVALFALQGPYGSSLPFADVTDGSLLGVTLGTTYGKLLLLRLLALGAAAPVWWVARRQGRSPSRLDAGGLALLVVESFSFAGHAGQGVWAPLASTMDAVHLAAASVWLGGLVVLGSVLLSQPRDAPAFMDLDAVLPRWSRVAMSAVLALIVTGAYQAWREIGGWDALAATAYGRLVLAKVGVLTLMLVLALYGRLWIMRRVILMPVEGRVGAGSAWWRRGRSPRGTPTRGAAHQTTGAPGTVLVRAPKRQEPSRARVGALRRSVAAEATMGVAVIALTAALVNAVPGRQAYLPTFTTALVGHSLAGDTVHVDVVIRPTSAGFEGLFVQASTAAGRALPLQSVVVSLTNPAMGIGPIELNLPATGTGRIEDALISVPSPGWWELTMQLRVDAFTTYSAATAYTVG